MKINFQCINQNKPYVITCGILFTLLSLCSYYYGKITIFLFLNTVHHQWMDKVMLLLTNFGTGLFSLLVFALFWLNRKWQLARSILITFLITGVLVQVLKHLYKAPRPKAIISSGTYSYFLEGITHSGLTSFPSGHATTIFALATVLAFACKNKYAALGYFFFASLIGYSRVYLGQHFMEDVLVGAMLGTITAISFFVLPKSVNSFYFKRGSPRKQLFNQWISNQR